MARAVILIDALEAENAREENLNSRRLRRDLRLHAQPLDISEAEFKAHYRLSKEVFLELCSELRPYLTRSRRNTRISEECRVLTALSFYASGSYQKPVGMSYLHGLSQASVSNAVREVTGALNEMPILRKYICFPQTHRERQSIINGFSNKFGFPGCIGCIDGTHVALVPPAQNEERFFNRKHYHSRNVQIICDSDLTILSIDASFGGATHDAHIYKASELPRHLQELHNQGEKVWLLGDSGYPLRPWLLTPIVNAIPGSPEEYYTKKHCLSRNTVERCIGVLKARWRCLLAHRVLHYDHNMVAKITNACAVLHNICNKHRLPVPDIPPEDVQADQNQQIGGMAIPEQVNDHQLLERGRQQQQQIVQRLWRARAM